MLSDTVQIRCLLERGRVLNSCGDAAAAIPLFLEARQIGQSAEAHDLGVDAAHMLGIAAPRAERMDTTSSFSADATSRFVALS